MSRKQQCCTKPSGGHLFQIAVSSQLQNVPETRKLPQWAFIEGWALYAESLGSALGLYGDAATGFGRLAMDRMRGARLVVDTGIHARGWTREQQSNISDLTPLMISCLRLTGISQCPGTHWRIRCGKCG